MGWLVGAIFAGIFAVACMIATIQSSAPDRVAPLVISILFFCICILCLYQKKRKAQRAEKGVVEDNLPTGYSYVMSAKHMDGLPWGEQADCNVYLYPDKYVFWRNKNTYTLSMDKITDVCIKTDVEIQKAYVSSVGGAIGGAALFGKLGAMIGGRVKEKTDTTISKFLIFTYNKDGETKYISFEIPFYNKKAPKYVKAYQAQASGHQNFHL